MRRALAFWIYFALGFLTFLVLLAGIIALLTMQVEEETRSGLVGYFSSNPALIFVPLILNGLAAFLAFRAFLSDYVLPIRRMTEETNIHAMVNPSHRLKEQGGRQVRRLAVAVNDMADKHEQLQNNFQHRLNEARAKLERENEILTSLVSGLSEGIVVCNLDGQILLYNQRAREYLGSPPQSGGASQIGLNRSVYDSIDRDLIRHGLETLKHRLQQHQHILPHRFAAAGSSGQLLQMQMLPVLDDVKKIDAIVLVIKDVTEQVEIDNRRDLLLTSLNEGLRTSLSHIRAAVETVTDYPAMETKTRDALLGVILGESQHLSGMIDQATLEYAGHFKSRWSMDTVRVNTLLKTLQRLAEDGGIRLEAGEEVPEIWVKVDSYTMTRILSRLMTSIAGDNPDVAVAYSAVRENRLAHLIFQWPGNPLSSEQLKNLRQEFISLEKEQNPFTIQEILDRHDAELWCNPAGSAQLATLNIIFPLVNPPTAESARVTVLDSSRPEFYDFDLFRRQEDIDDDLLSRRLDSLTFTVFDTETTGLDPAGGDEILSIGAVRLVNGRLLRSETFDQLVKPVKPVPRESIEIHGIQPEMLRNQPGIETALPAFHHFCRDTILVAHNAAFDMRFLSLFERNCGVRFDHPVLDTLLLSAVAHPNQDRHNLDAIAERFGVTIIGRHTALGDALVTAEILLKLIPVLISQGIKTLGQAQEASRDTFYARIKY